MAHRIRQRFSRLSAPLPPLPPESIPEKGSPAIERSCPVSSTWIPVSLRIASLSAFVVLFAILGLTLILIWVFAKRSDGFNVILNNHYIWVYGPTALLIFIISLWRQVDYNCKILTPWKELASGSEPTSKTIQLDYISPFQLITFYQAISNGHIAVVLTTLGFFTLKLITVASTGLLVLTSIDVNVANQSLLTTTRFNYPRIGNTLSDVNNTSPIYLAYGYLVKSMPFVDGVTNNTAYQSVSMPAGTNTSNATYSADVQALSPSFKCQRIKLPAMQDTGKAFKDSIVEFSFATNPTCNYTGAIDLCNPATVRCASSDVDFFHDTTDCGRTGEIWHYFSQVEWYYSQTLNSTGQNATVGNPVKASNSSIRYGNDSTWLCQLNYEMKIAHVTYDTSRSPPSVNISSLDKALRPTFTDFTATNLSVEIDAALLNSSTMLGSGDLLQNILREYINGTVESMIQTPDVLGPALEAIMTQIAAQIVSQVAMQDTVTKIAGTVVFPQSRLKLSGLILGLMGGGFIVMILITCGVIWTRPIGIESPDRVDTVKMIASILPQSVDLGRLFSDYWKCRELEATKQMKDVQFSLESHARGDGCSKSISVTHSPAVETTISVKSDNGPFWWKPLTLMKPALVFTMIMPLILIIVLEFLQRKSDRSSGFVAIETNASSILQSFYTRFLPALLMLLVATLFTSLDFNAAVLAPLNSLRNEHTSTYRILSTSILGKLPPLALLTALENRQWSAALAAVAAFTGSVLTIVVSGLYTIELVSSTTSLTLVRQDSFKLQWTNSSTDDGGSAVLLSMIESANLTYPSLTYDGLVFPNLTTIAVSDKVPTNGSGLLHLTVPALRGNLDCQQVVPPLFNWTFYNETRIENWFLMANVGVPLPPYCQRGGQFGNETTLNFTLSHSFPTANEGRYNYAKLFDLYVGPYEALTGPTCELPPCSNPDNPPGCPTLVLSYGWADTQSTVSNPTIVVCNQQIQQVETALTLTYPDLTIPPSYPPIPNEQVVQVLASDSNNITAFPFRLEGNFQNSFSLFNPSPAYSSVSKNLEFDHFFTGVLFGKEDYDFQVFYEDQFETAIQNFYSRYMAQVINTKMRNAQPSDDKSNNTIAASLSLDSSVPRILQHKTSKLILQVLLGVMVFFGMLSLHFGKFHKIVPWNPCSIAGVVVLLAGSKICEPRHPVSHNIIEKEKRISVAVTEIIDSHENTPLIGDDEMDSWQQPPPQARTRLSVGDQTNNSLWERIPSSEQRHSHIAYQPSHDFDLRKAHLRLGWWRDGVFFGEGGPSPREMELDRSSYKPRWRYGIDEQVYPAHSDEGMRSKRRPLSGFS